MGNPEFSSSADKLVLIVDDDKGVRELLEVLVRKEGFQIETAVDGEDALARARKSLPHIILLDLMLPKSGGFEVLHELQAEETAGIPVIVMTGRNMDGSTFDLIRQEPNVREFIQKPLKTELLASLIHKVLKTRPPAKKPA